MKKYLCFDVGGLSLKYSILDKELNVYQSNQIEYELAPKKVIWQKIKEIYLANKNKYQLDNEIFVSSSGIVNSLTKEIFWLDVTDKTYSENVNDLLGLPEVNIYLENDARSALRAEINFGKIKNPNVVLYTIGTALGGALQINHQILQGQNLMVGEIGIGRFSFNDEINISQSCGMYGLSQRYWKKTGEKISGQEIWKRAQLGQTEAIQETNFQIQSLTNLIVNTILLLDVEQVLIGGQVSQNSFFLNQLQTTIDKLCQQLKVKMNFKLSTCSFLNNAGKIGVLCLKEKDLC